MNIYASQMDPDMWGDPENFRPERFLDDEDNIINEHNLLTFSIGRSVYKSVRFSDYLMYIYCLGRRNCIGEAVAEAAVFSFITRLMQKYELLPITLGHDYDISPVSGATLKPKPFQIRVQRRDQQGVL